MGFLLLNLVGAVIKHVPLVKWIPNDLIPFVNLGIAGLMTGGDWGAAAAMTGQATLAHQAAKLPVRAIGRKVGSPGSGLNGVVGPGAEISI